eukprot:scaffold260_cov328-Prasinococcus_capsulatus_cf.AAC.8
MHARLGTPGPCVGQPAAQPRRSRMHGPASTHPRGGSGPGGGPMPPPLATPRASAVAAAAAAAAASLRARSRAGGARRL